MEAKASRALEIVFKAQERKKARGRKPEVALHRSGVSLGADLFCKFVSKKPPRTSVDYKLADPDSPEIVFEYKKAPMSPDRLSATLLADHEFPSKKLGLAPRASAPVTPLLKSLSQPQRVQRAGLDSACNRLSPAPDQRADSPVLDASANDASPTRIRTQSSAWRTGASFFPAPANVSDFEQKLAADAKPAHSPRSSKKSAAPYIHLFRKNVYRSHKNSPLKAPAPLKHLPFPRSSAALPNDSTLQASRLESRNFSGADPAVPFDLNARSRDSASHTRLDGAPALHARHFEARGNPGLCDGSQPVHVSRSFVKKRMSLSVSNNIVASKNGKQSKTSLLRAIVHRADSFL